MFHSKSYISKPCLIDPKPTLKPVPTNIFLRLLIEIYIYLARNHLVGSTNDTNKFFKPRNPDLIMIILI